MQLKLFKIFVLCQRSVEKIHLLRNIELHLTMISSKTKKNKFLNCIHNIKYFLLNIIIRSRISKIQIQALGKAVANSFLYFIQVTAFGYGAILVENGEMTFDEVFRVFIVINFALMSVGRSTSSMPDYNLAKAAAQRILALRDRKSTIDPYDTSGIQLVSVD